jgi:hypothetical protein
MRPSAQRKACSTPSRPKICRGPAPSARRMANSPTRSRTDTVAFTTKPIMAKASAARKPMRSAPCSAAPSGASRRSLRNAIRSTTSPFQSGCAARARAAGAVSAPRTASHHSLGSGTVRPAVSSRSVIVGRSTRTAGRSGAVDGSAGTTPTTLIGCASFESPTVTVPPTPRSPHRRWRTSRIRIPRRPTSARPSSGTSPYGAADEVCPRRRESRATPPPRAPEPAPRPARPCRSPAGR